MKKEVKDNIDSRLYADFMIGTMFTADRPNNRKYVVGFDPAVPDSDRTITTIIPTCMPKKETNHFVEELWKKLDDTKETGWDIGEIQAKHIQKCKEIQEQALTQAILSCGYQYDEVLQYLKNRQRFEITRLQFGDMLSGHTECVLYDSYMQKAFILITESRTMNIEDFDGTSTLNIESHRNRQVPYNYHR